MTISKRTRDFLAYLIGGTVVLFGTLLLIAIATGWTYDLRTGELRETGLLLMGSEPTGANISVNDAPLKQRTNYRWSNVAPGTYRLQYSKAGYRSWSSQVSVEPAEVTFADYAWLLPNEIPVKQRYANLQITAAAQTQDRRRFVFVEQPPSSTSDPTPQPRLLTSTDLTRPPVTLYAPATPTAAKPNRVIGFDSFSFSDDASNLLVRAVYTTGEAEWLVMPSTPSDTPRISNLTTELLINPNWLSWGPRSNNDLYYIEKGILRRIQINQKAISESLAESVVSAKWSNEWLSYVTDTPAPAERIVYIRRADQAVADKIGTVPRSANYQLAYFRTIDKDFLAVLPVDSKDLIVFTNALRNSDQRTKSVSARNVTTFTVSPNGRFLVHNSRGVLTTIDFERLRRYRSATSLVGLTSWEWMNDQHLAISINGTLRLTDYDGQNNEVIAQNFSPTSPILFSENKSLLGFVTTPPVAPDTSPTQSLYHFFLVPEKQF